MTGEAGRERQRRRAVRKAKRNRDEARANLLAQHRKLAARRAENRRRVAEKRDEASSPHSTVPRIETEDEGATGPNHSTVPRRPPGSDDDPPLRLYGLRLRRAAAGDDAGDVEGESR